MPISVKGSISKVAAVNQIKSLVDGLQLPLQYEKDDWQVDIDYYHIDDFPEHLREWALTLFKANMLTMYKNSKDGWNEDEKRSELFAKEARYLVARSRTDPTRLFGYLLFQIVQEETMDDDVLADVAYCYELQIEDSARGRGLGEYLVKLLEDIGKRWSMDKVMLTVFKVNTGAFKFYTKKLAFELDEISPGKCLSARQARKFDYEILSKALG
ncbi:hypothetical protein K450DRAFT_258402 [Umbelopsis ramanniana AG]|uniref:N-alpha-acetyltransferase 40 n=1 Tax=Umbelopsis ramanniana AG TaxID=1314678 RepID=A0AAD5HAT7_UMBRA|nr:uncharacterized protein K450DRAFT_258402 [Umbelopsis ramanniana AG]KAI8576089.1 hypothetical protein K450DRAFT_258402 [Umbelopsis ramanniana AG]